MDEIDAFKQSVEHTKQILASTGIVLADAHLAIDGLVLKGAQIEIKSKSAPSILAYRLPGMSEKVIHPVSRESNWLIDIIVDLNDRHKWTREAIADWLETLDIDLTFKEKK